MPRPEDVTSAGESSHDPSPDIAPAPRTPPDEEHQHVEKEKIEQPQPSM